MTVSKMRNNTIRHLFVERFPDHLEPGILYVSIKFANMSHLCCCGCGHEVITPLDPKDWQMIYDGKTISVHPSIGNWDLPCRSHYIIRNGRIHWAKGWTTSQIEAARRRDILNKVGSDDTILPSAQDTPTPKVRKIGAFRRIVNYIFRNDRS